MPFIIKVKKDYKRWKLILGKKIRNKTGGWGNVVKKIWSRAPKKMFAQGAKTCKAGTGQEIWSLIMVNNESPKFSGHQMAIFTVGIFLEIKKKKL